MREDFESRFKERWEERKRRWEERREHHGRHGHIWTGVFILLIGTAALIKATVTDLPEWVFSWQTFLMALGLFIGIKHGFKGGAWFILILVGGAFLLRDFYPDVAIRRYIWPVVLMIVGVLFIFRPRRRLYAKWQDCEKKKTAATNSGVEAATVVEEAYESQKDYT